MKERITRLQNSISGLMAKGETEAAYPFCKMLFKLVSAEYGLMARETAVAHNQLGLCLIGMNALMRADTEFQQALSIMDRNDDWAHSVDKSVYLQNAASLKYAMWLFLEGDALLITAAKLRQPLLKPDDEMIASLLEYYGDNLPTEPTEDGSNATANRAICLAEIMYGTGYVSCIALEALLEIYQDKDAQIEAKAILQHLANRYLDLFGQYSHFYGDACFRLAPYYLEHGERDEWTCAIGYYEAEMTVQERQSPPEVDRICDCLKGLADVYDALGQTAQSEACLIRMLDLYREHRFPDSLISETLDRVASIHLGDKAYRKAVAEMQESVKVANKVKTGGFIMTKRYLNLGKAYEQMGIYEDSTFIKRAVMAYRKALRLAKQTYGNDSTPVAQILNALAGVHVALKKLGKAIEFYKQSLAVQAKVGDVTGCDVAGTLNNLALIYIDEGDYKMAKRYLRKALTTIDTANDPEDSRLIPIWNNLSLTMTGLGKTAKGLEAMERAVQLQEETSGPQSPEMVTPLQNLAGLLALSGGAARSAEVYTRAIRLSEAGDDEEELASLQSELADVNAGLFNKPITEFWMQEAIEW